jgi:hypothetical protein
VCLKALIELKDERLEIFMNDIQSAALEDLRNYFRKRQSKIGRRPRRDALTEVLNEIADAHPEIFNSEFLSENGMSSLEFLLQKLEPYRENYRRSDGIRVIENIDYAQEMVEWADGDRAMTTSFRGLQARLTRIKEKKGSNSAR